MSLKKYLITIPFIFLCLSAKSVVVPVSNSTTSTWINPVNTLEHFAALSIKEVQKLVGRKLKIKEKIAIKVFQWKIKKGFTTLKAEEKKDKGKTAMIFGIAGLASLLIPIPYIGGLSAIVCTVLALVLGYQARKENRDDKKAKAAIILGWVTVGLFVLAMVFVVALIASLGF